MTGRPIAGRPSEAHGVKYLQSHWPSHDTNMAALLTKGGGEGGCQHHSAQRAVRWRYAEAVRSVRRDKCCRHIASTDRTGAEVSMTDGPIAGRAVWQQYDTGTAGLGDWHRHTESSQTGPPIGPAITYSWPGEPRRTALPRVLRGISAWASSRLACSRPSASSYVKAAGVPLSDENGWIHTKYRHPSQVRR